MSGKLKGYMLSDDSIIQRVQEHGRSRTTERDLREESAKVLVNMKKKDIAVVYDN